MMPVEAAAESRAEDFLAARGLKPGRRLVILNPGSRRRDKRFLRLLDNNLARHQEALKLLRDDRQ